MLHISHQQTPPYHPESNGAIERLRWRIGLWRHGPRNYPLYSSDSAQSRGKTLFFPQLRQFLGLQLCCLMNFCKLKKFLFDSIIKNFSKTLDAPASSLPGHNSSVSCPASCQPSSSLPSPSGSVVAAWSHLSSHSTTAPTPFCAMAPTPSPSESSHKVKDKVIAISHFKACTAADAKPGSPHHRGRPPSSRPGSPAATKWALFSDPLVSSPSSLTLPRDGPGTVFLPSEEVFALPGLARLHSLHRRGTHPVNRHRHRGWGEPCGELPTPLVDGQTSRVYPINPVQ